MAKDKNRRWKDRLDSGLGIKNFKGFLTNSKSNAVIFVAIVGSMGKAYRFILLFLWLLGLMAPCAYTLLHEEQHLLVMTASEEEQQEVMLKIQDEEKMVNRDYFNIFQLTEGEEVLSFHIAPLVFLDCPTEILLPPPELLS